jgi:hypothetical protein
MSRASRTQTTHPDHAEQQNGGSSARQRDLEAITALRGYLQEADGGKAPTAADLVGAEVPPEAQGALLHDDRTAGEILANLGTPGLALGRHILLDPGLSGAERLRVLNHELGHVMQTGAREPDLSAPIALGADADSLERTADVQASIRAVIHRGTSPNRVRRWPMDIPHSLDPGMREANRREAQRRETARQRHIEWDKSRNTHYQQEVARQPRSIDEDIERSNQQLLGIRSQAVAMLSERGDIPPELAAHVRQAALAVIQIQALITAREQQIYDEIVAGYLNSEGDALSPDDTEGPRTAFNGFYVLATEMVSRDDARTLAEWERDQQSLQQIRQQRAQPRQSICNQGCHSEPGATTFDFDLAETLFNRPQPTANAPELTPLAEGVDSAEYIVEWELVLIDYQAATVLLDNALRRALPTDTEAARELGAAYRHFMQQRERQENFRRAHYNARRVPAVFYPRDKFVTDGQTQLEIAHGIPWEFHVTAENGSWSLYDLTSGRGRPVTHPISDEEQQRLDAGEEVDPPQALFDKLDHAELFPKGIVHGLTPGGYPFDVPIEHEWELSDWLAAIGIGFAALAIIVGSAGTATPFVVGGVSLGLASAGFSIASTIVEMDEREARGILTEGDVNRAYFNIGLDVIGALALGMGSAMRLASGTTSALSRFGILSSRAFIVMTRTAQVGDATGNIINAWVVGADLVAAYNTLQEQRDSMTDADYEAAVAQLTMTAMLTGVLSTIAIKGSFDDLVQGGLRHISEPDADGNVNLRHAEEAEATDGPGPHAGDESTDAPPMLRRPDETPPMEDETGWAPAGQAPKPVHDPNLVAEAAIDIRYGPDGLPEEVRLRYRDEAAYHDTMIPSLNNPVLLHQEVIRQFTGIRGRIRRALARLRAIFTGREIPLHLQMEIWKHRRDAANTMSALRNGLANDMELNNMQRRLDRLEEELDRLEEMIDNPALLENLDPNMVATRITPQGFPNPPDGFHYSLRRGGTEWELAPDSGHGPRLDVEMQGGMPTGNFTNTSRIRRANILNGDVNNPWVRRRLEGLGYTVDSLGRVRRPSGHADVGEMRRLTTYPDPQPDGSVIRRVTLVEEAQFAPMTSPQQRGFVQDSEVLNSQLRQVRDATSLQVPPRFAFEAPWVGNGPKSNAMGYLRDNRAFWTAFRDRNPRDARLLGLPETGPVERSPRVTAAFAARNPAYQDYIGQILDHHHLNNGPLVVPLPRGVHNPHSVPGGAPEIHGERRSDIPPPQPDEAVWPPTQGTRWPVLGPEE